MLRKLIRVFCHQGHMDLPGRPAQGAAGGGHGAERRIRFLEPMTVALLANSREQAPEGLNGGQNGQTGEAWIEHPDDRSQTLGGRDRADLKRGAMLVIRTPGGGGWGSDE